MAGFFLYTAPGPSGTQISNLNIGGGGYVTSFDMNSDGTMLNRIDIFGAYIASTVVGTTWQQMATQSAMPSTYTSTPTPYLFGGAWEIKIDPSNSNNLWMIYSPIQGNGLTTLLKSTNKGATWTATGFPLFSASSTTASRYLSGQRIAVDPNNSNVIWASSQTHLYESHDGGTTFNQVDGGGSGLPAATGAVIGFVGIQFDPISTVTGGKTTRLIVGDTGNGFYVSTNANLGTSSTWTLVNAITTPGKGKMASNGFYYANNQAQSNALYRIDTSASFSTLTPGGGVAWVAVDPNNPDRAVTAQFGQVVVGGPISGSPAWSSPNSTFAISAPDAPWIVNTDSIKNVQEVYFDPFKTTSTASSAQAIDNTNTKTFTDLPTGLNLVAGDLIRITNTGTPGNYMLRTVGSYSGTTLVTSATGPTLGGYLGGPTGGSGTFSAWTITKERLWASTGFGMFWLDGIKTSGTNTWNSMNFGMDMVVAHQVVWPTGSYPLLTQSDTPIYPVPLTPIGATVGLASYGPTNAAPLREGVSADWASNTPSLIAMINSSIEGGGTVFRGTNSSNGASGSWSAFATPPTIASGMTSVAMADSNTVVLTDSNGAQYTTDGGTTWNTVPTVPTNSGWTFNGANGRFSVPPVNVAADRVNIGTFYLYNGNKSVYKLVLPSATVTTQATSLDPRTDSFKWILKSVPPNGGASTGGHLFWTSGDASDAPGLYASLANVLAFTPSTTTYPFKFSSNAGVTWTPLATISGVLGFGFGAVASGQSYPSIYIAGWVSGVYGIWRCDNFNPSSLGSETWTNVGTFARGWIDLPTCMEGDPSQWGRFIIGHNGSSYGIGQVIGQTNGWP